MSGENQYLIAADGMIYPLRDLGVRVTGISEIPVEYQTTQGYKQHGVTVLDWRLQTRTISFAFEVYALDRLGYWQARERLIATLRPNLGVVTYRQILPDGRRRDIDGWLQPGLALAEVASGRSFDAAFSLTCPEPSFYDPAVQTATLAAQSLSAFVLPFAVPDDMWLGGTTQLYTTLTTEGTWRAYPTITIQGPYARLNLANDTTGATFTLGTALAAGDTLLVDLTPGAQTIQRNGVVSLDELEDGNLVDWHLVPGDNTLHGSGTGLTGATGITVQWSTRYIAL